MKTLYTGSYLDVCEADNGHVIVSPRDAVAVLIYNIDEQTLAMVLQERTPVAYRHPQMPPLMEIPAGGIEPGEMIDKAAAREVREEVGYVIEQTEVDGQVVYNMEHIASVFASPGYSTEQLHIFCATVRERQRTYRDEDEGVAVELKLDTVKAMLTRGYIRDAKTWIALNWFFGRL